MTAWHFLYILNKTALEPLKVLGEERIMKKYLLSLFFLGYAWGMPCAQEKPVFVAEDFANQSKFWVQDNRDAQQCQATRILPNWYMTAAHCVRPYCDKQCQLTFALLQGELQASAQVYHTASNPRVFTPRQYHRGEAKSIRYDVALIYFNPAEEDYFFYDARNKKVLDRGGFLKALNLAPYSDQRSQWLALEQARPKIFVIPEGSTRHAQYSLAVPDLRGAGIFFHDSKTSDFYYFKELHHYMGSNFGVQKGMSGSGVIMPGGDILGVVSSSLSTHNSLITYDDKDQPVHSVPYSADYFLFTPLTPSNMNFIRATISSFHQTGQNPYFMYIGSAEAKPSDATVQNAFPQALSVNVVLSAEERK